MRIAEARVPLLLGIFIGAAALVLRTPLSVSAAAATLLLLPLCWFAFSVSRAWIVPFFAALILLPPLFGVHGSIVFAAVGLLTGIARASEWRIRITLLNIAMLAFPVALTISLAFALWNSGSAATAGSAVRVLLFSISVYLYFSASQGPDRASYSEARTVVRALFGIAVLAAVFACLDFVYQFPAPGEFGAQFLWLASGVYRRAQGLFYEASTLGNFCAFFLILCVVCLGQPRESRILPRWIAGLGVVLFSGTLILTFSRAALIGAALGSIAAITLERTSWANRRALLGLGALVLAAIGLFSVFLPEFATGYASRLLASGADIFDSPDRVLSGRLETWLTLGGFIAENPGQTLLGIGYKTLPNTSYLGHPLIADNAYLSSFVETGILGLGALLLLNLAILRTSWKAFRAGSFYGKWMFCFWIAEMVQMFSADVLTYWRVLPLYFWVLAQAVRSDHAPADD